ncbi:MAG TPA: GNAT family protein [Caldilineaceae bacterium]|nr:GNAT family protein [Caldilineaceae bacterium]
MDDFPINERLPEATLARAASLPRKPDPVVLEGRTVRLKPMEPARDAPALHALTNGAPAQLNDRQIAAYDADALVWRYLGMGPYADADALAAALAAWAAAPDVLCFCVVDRASGTPVGTASLMSNMPNHLKIELGNIWYSPLVQRTAANREAAYLMLGHVFGLGYRRVEWKCNALNARSRQAALRLGFQFEGIQESHMIVKGRSRDTAWYRMLAHEWPGVKARLEEWLYGNV